MKGLANVALVVAMISLILGIITRLTMKPIPIAPGVVTVMGFLVVANTCLLIAIALLLKAKQ